MAVATLWIAIAPKGRRRSSGSGFTTNSWPILKIAGGLVSGLAGHSELRTGNHCSWLSRVAREGVEIVANAVEAKVIFLRSHPAWAAARRRDQERRQAMRRHPSFLARRRAAASGGDVIRDFKVYSNTDVS